MGGRRKKLAMRTKLPDDAQLSGWKETSPMYYEKVFVSLLRNFTGTEDEFYDAGFAYRYEDLGNGWRSLYFKYPPGS